MKSSGFKDFQFLWKNYETMSNRRPASSQSNAASRKKLDHNNNHTDNITETFQARTSVERNTNLTDNTQHNPLQIPKLSWSEILTGEIPNSSVELQQQDSEFYSSEQTQTTAERSRVQHQGRIEAANHFLQNQDLEGNQLIQQLNQLDTKNQQDNNPSEKTQLIPSTSKKGTTATSCKIWIFHS